MKCDMKRKLPWSSVTKLRQINFKLSSWNFAKSSATTDEIYPKLVNPEPVGIASSKIQIKEKIKQNKI